MLNLYILRHAISALADQGAETGKSDFERPLNERGKADLDLIRTTIMEAEYFPSHVYCSPAVRTRATLEGIKSVFPGSPATEYPEHLYSGSTPDYLKTIQVHERQEPLMLVGHNPMCASLAVQLCSKGEASALENVAIKFPAGAFVAIEFEAENWSQISSQLGYLKAFHLPGK